MEINTKESEETDELPESEIKYREKIVLKDEKEYCPIKINVRFIYNENIYNVVCNEDELLSSIFGRFKKKSQTEELELYFVYNGGKLNPKMKLNQINSDLIKVYKEGENRGGGQFSIKFTDMSKKKTEEQYFSDKAPSYRLISQGINIYGICKFKKCIAYEKEVICPLKNIKRFDLIKEKDDLLCPKCEAIISPKTIGFYRCEYRIKGTKYFNKEVKDFQFEGKAENKNSIQYYNPDKNGEIILTELIIEIIKDL